MKIFYNSQEYQIELFIKEYLNKHNPQPTDDFINQIIEQKQLKKFITDNRNKTFKFDDSKNLDAVNGIKDANVKLNTGDSTSICEEAELFGQQFLSLFEALEVYKAPEQQGQNQQPQEQKDQKQQNQQNHQVVEELSEELKKKYNFSITLGDNSAEKIKRFKVVDNANGGADGGDNIFTDELGKALHCTSNSNALHVNTTALKANLENTNVEVKEGWWGILSDLGFYWDNEIKITNPSEKGKNNADTIGKEGLNRAAIQQKIKEEEKRKLAEIKPALDNKLEPRHEREDMPQLLGEKDDIQGEEREDIQVDKIQAEIVIPPQFPNLNNINFDAIDISKKTFTFDVKKYGSLFEIVAEDEKNGGSYRFQLDEASTNQDYKAIYDLIKGKNGDYNFKADEGIQGELNKLLGANNIEKWNLILSNDAKKDAIINKNANAYSYSYYRDAKKNTDINVNFGLLEKDIENQNDFEKLIYEQGVKSEFFVKVNDTNNAEEYVKFSLYWDEENQKPAIHLAKSLNGKNIKLYGSNQELCGSVAKDNANYFKDIKVSFQLYYNRDKTMAQNDDNKALCFINDTEISKFFNSSKASDLDLNSSIVTNKKATKEITAKERELTQEEKTEEIKKINQALEKELKNAFPEQNGVVNPLIASINAFVKGDNNAVMPNEIQEANQVVVNGLKEKYQAKLNLINVVPANRVNNPQDGRQGAEQGARRV